jgi:uncharacterized protein (DUF2141 family)
MKTLSLIITLILSTTLSFAQTETKQEVTVTIENTTNNRGSLSVALHSQETFMKSGGIQNVSSKITGDKVIVTFKDVAPGNYAIMVLHDENNNQQMDFEPNGMPLESYGISNNPMLMGPPRFSDGKFEVVDKNIELTIKL